MTVRESRVIRNFILKANVEEMEFYEEIYDHIASSYEQRASADECIEDHITNVIVPSFGGVEGLESMVDKQKRLSRTRVFNNAFKKFSAFFTTASGLLKSLLVASFIYLLSTFASEFIFLTTIDIIFIIPAITAYVMQLRFKYLCRKRRLPFKTSFTNQMVFLISIMCIGLFQGLPDIIHRIAVGSRFNTLTYLEQFDFIFFPVVFLFTIYTWVCLTLIAKSTRLNTSATL
ncbi:hypothetical protein [Roseivirga misakiensis]|uniref:Uncharacterized protein n=1 Tax=Roseivirga misakiensis TaxID=1563681 RepID=A0A1E5T0V4_9BACT|nr:hypothetical protein [Roseivirga misakiensis]OEK05012.1 hypothetical protein BFP71_16455 [Roseivirga misakiensis]